jgi:hypothetical protein
MLLSVPPQLSPAKLVQYMKGKSRRMLQDEYPRLKKPVLRSTPVCAGLFLHERMRGGRRNDQATHQKPAVGVSKVSTSRSQRKVSLEPQTGSFQSQLNQSDFQPVVV